ncbi:hypothetical protein ED28_03160 [[Pantoea] beijingensis]|uniref:OmpR/PhoB-type domain-containing protein n=1 Tax=[Pantoea] beijingensis TaxID=1324864 RepID=A0A443IH35_9GAMM|nr:MULTISPECIES: transcriptional regulator [Erwiniaceae]RWR03310.1 hypothetical protein ED28_03160 [[Pantoea] beijingensis]
MTTKGNDKDEQERVTFILNGKVKFFPSRRCLAADDGTIVELSENSYRLLFLLLKGKTDKQTLINEVWSEQRGSVSESSYYGQLYLLRKAFSLAGLPNSLIKTIPRKGVKYVGNVSEERMTDDGEKTDMAAGDRPVNECEMIKDDEPGVIHVDETEAIIESKSQNPEWYNSRSWNILVSSLAVLAVCWLTTLIFAFVFFFIGNGKL